MVPLQQLSPDNGRFGEYSSGNMKPNLKIRQNLVMNPDSHEEFPVTLDDATKAKLDEAIASTGLTAGDVLRLAIETGLHVMESARRN